MTQDNRFSFTDARIAELQPSEAKARTIYHDSKTPGLTVVITRAGTKSFYFQRRICRRPEKIFLGHFPSLSVVQARTNTAAYNAAVHEGLNPAQVRRAAR